MPGFNRITFEELEDRVEALETTKSSGMTPALKKRLTAGDKALKALEKALFALEERVGT